MNKRGEKFNEKIKVKMQVISADSDYIGARLLFLVGNLPAAGRLANSVIDSYAKAFLWSIDRNDIVKKIKELGRNKSHDINKILDFIVDEELLEIWGENTKESVHKVIGNFFNLYCMRYMDIFESQSKFYADIGVADVYILDQIVYKLRKAIHMLEVYWQETPINQIFYGKSKILGLAAGEYLTKDNKYFKLPFLV